MLAENIATFTRDARCRMLFRSSSTKFLPSHQIFLLARIDSVAQYCNTFGKGNPSGDTFILRVCSDCPCHD
jgi:hypothetical protein